MNSLQRPRRAAGFKLETLDDEVLLYHPGQTRAIYMNQTAALVWALCDGRTVEDITDALSGAFPDAVTALPDDVRVTITQLAEYGALQES